MADNNTAKTETSGNVLHMQDVTMQFGGVVAVNGLTLDVQ